MRTISVIVVVLLVLNVVVTPNLMAQDRHSHVISPQQLRGALVARSISRAENIAEIRMLLSHEEVRIQLGALADLKKIDQAIPTLADEELARLAAESRMLNEQVQAGITKAGWIWIAIGVFLAILVIYYAANCGDCGTYGY